MRKIVISRKVSQNNEADLTAMVGSVEAFVKSKYPDVSFDSSLYCFRWNSEDKYSVSNGGIEHRVDSLDDKHTIRKEMVYLMALHAEHQMDRCRDIVEEYCGEKLYDSPRYWHSNHNKYLQERLA